MASYNQVSDYWQFGIRVSQPTAPVTAIGNIFWSEAGHSGVNITGEKGIVEDNRVEKTHRRNLNRKKSHRPGRGLEGPRQ